MPTPQPTKPRPPPPPRVPHLYSGPDVPAAYDQNWQLYTNLTDSQIEWFMAQPEWQNFVAWVALDPPAATIHANAPDMTTIMAALQAANVPVSVNPTPLPSPPTPGPVR